MLQQPKKLKLMYNDADSTYKFAKRMSELGGVVKYDIIKNNVIVSDKFILEFKSYPSEVLNVDAGFYKTNLAFFDSRFTTIHDSEKFATLGDFFSNIYLYKCIEEDNISIQPYLYDILIREQKKIIGSFGKKITMASLIEMKTLDAFIKESLVQTNFILSNGDYIKKGSLISINAFSKQHKLNNFQQKFRNFDISRHLKSNSNQNIQCDIDLIWGYGSRVCPFKKYAISQIKIIIVTFIRNFYIFANSDGFEVHHPGYHLASTVMPKSNELFLKRRNL
ncbi:hypothetical protein BB561_006038 [Smittium simulii]|uniref:Cytochrome P450 n=1 Tax=Smittium simulii TaxID=133385 RepID=A0A2T9Y6U7_9FUNG|nr:hypothetical protein BB561_006038 [Smittium simulii]